jgi:hypothetical protein
MVLGLHWIDILSILRSASDPNLRFQSLWKSISFSLVKNGSLSMDEIDCFQTQTHSDDTTMGGLDNETTCKQTTCLCCLKA